jgi:hypothetical protein
MIPGNAESLQPPTASGPAPLLLENRQLGRIDGRQRGPTLLCLGGVHGNEPAGVLALQRVFRHLHAAGTPLRGDFIGLAGNLTALARGRRFIDRDLNRLWTPERLAAVQRPGLSVEDREQVQLLRAIEAVLKRARGDVFVVDLHTTSGLGPPFVTLGDTLRNRAFARRLPIPIILGIEEQLEGTLLDFIDTMGVVTLGVEGGQHEAPQAVDNSEAAVWIALVAAGIVRRAAILPHYEAARRRLRESARHVPPVLEVRYRHAVQPQDNFRMKPGYLNFQPLVRGEVLAHSRAGDVRAPENGRILMPLYQELGNDGFFLVREVNAFWLRLSSWLRRLHADRVATWLPGVRRHPAMPGAVVVDRSVARWYAVELFHLLGFRREAASGTHLVMSRRRFDDPG